MDKLDLSQIPLIDLIIAMQYRVNKEIDEAEDVVKTLTRTFPDKAHISEVVSEFRERIDWLSVIKGDLEMSLEKASPRLTGQLRERRTLLIQAFREDDYITPARPFKPRKSGKPTGKRREVKPDPNRPCQYCKIRIRPENHTDHESGCRRNPKNMDVDITEVKDKQEPKPCQYCGRYLLPKNLGRHERVCPKNPKVTCRQLLCRTTTGTHTDEYCLRCSNILGIPKKKPVKKKVKKKIKTKKKAATGQLSPHNPAQQSVWDEKHRAGVEKSEVKQARYLCNACGHVEMIKYTGKSIIECPKCKGPRADIIARFNDKGERIEDLQIEDQANVCEKE